MDRLTVSETLAESNRDSSWLVDNVFHPFMNGTGVTQICNNFREEKLEPWHVPHADTFSKDWAAQTLASASGAVVTYAVVGKLTGVGLTKLGAQIGLEGGAARFINHHATGQILGAGLFDFAKSPNQGETRIGNSVGSMAAFAVFASGNGMVNKVERIANNNIYAGVGRIAVGAAGGLTGLETSRLVSRGLGSDAPAVTGDERWTAMLHGGFVNFALPVVQKTIVNTLEGAPASADNSTPEQARVPRVHKVANEVTGFDRLAETAKTTDSTVSTLVEGPIKVMLLKQQFEAGARRAQMDHVATELATFIGGSKKSLHAALYDLRLKDPKIESLVVNALNERAENGVDVRLAFFKPNQKSAADGFVPIEASDGPVGPSPEFLAKLSPKIKTHTVNEPVAANGDFKIPDIFGDALGKGTGGRVTEAVIDAQNGNTGGLEVGMAGIVGGGKLMHHKYLVRDAGTRSASIWTGSTNLTDSAFGMQDNNIVQIRSAPLARVFDKNFNELWEKGALVGTGKDSHTTVKVGDGSVSVAFSPGDGALIEAEIASRIAAANTQVHIASMVISSEKILQALATKIDEGKHVAGIYDGPQMRNVANAWARSSSPESQVKIALWERVKGSLTAKNSHPYNPEGPHDFMHNKTVSIDGSVVMTGSFNLSLNAMKNAENILTIANPQVATHYDKYIQDLVKSYDGAPRRVAKTE